jgi:type IV pilus assembly protein PilY1
MKTYRNLILWLSLLVLLPAISFAGTLADSPLSLKGGVPPNVMFALSVEFPTANTAAYQGTNDYTPDIQYLGYFDPEKCYDYDSTNGYFVPTGLWNGPTARQCFPNWSGNFLNWASMTGLDEFRYAMTGGNRSTDTSSLTVLERSYQSGQGGTSNFPNKTWTENYTTPWPGGTALTIQNQGQGVQMTITPNGTDTAKCTDPTLSGSFSCTGISLASDGTAGSCSTYSGLGTSGSPYKCTSFGAFGAVIPTSVTPAVVSTATGASSTTTVNCTGPTLTGSTFSCTLALSNGHTATCTAGWTGAGTAADPYTCSTFGTFSGGETFNPSGGNTTSSFTTSAPGTTVVETVSCTMSTSGSVKTMSCPLSNGDTASCSVFSGSGSNGNPYYCPNFGFTGGEVLVSNVPSGSTTYSGKKYRLTNKISYQIPATTTKYYISAYPGSDTTGYYYYSSYNVAWGTSQTFNVRVKVCDNSVGLESNCNQYGTSYKPTGSVQNNGDKMKFGVTSYFQANDIDNAVLRSKAKYVAPTKYSSSGGTIANPLSEWNPNDGTLYSNPDSTDSATANSFIGTSTNTGVINYVNKFGSTSHSYKTYDDVGKLYYETLKYLRGGQNPTTSFYNGAKTSNSDGFPVITSWDDPVQYTCQKNYIITMGDTHTWCDKRLPNGTYSAVGNGVCNAYTDGNSNSHPADYSSLGGDSGVDVTLTTNKVGALEGLGNIATTVTGAGGASYSMAGLSYWAASQDFRPDLIGDQHVQSYIIDVQENRDCGYQSQYWLTAKYGNPDSYDSTHSWLTSVNPAMGTTTLPAGNCGSRAPTGYNASGGDVAWPKNLLRAGDPQSMIASVNAAIAQIAGQIGDEAALAQSSGSLDTGTGAYIYRALYNSTGWTGDLQALTIDTTGAISSIPAWKASAKLPIPTGRNVVTFNDGRDAAGATESNSNSRKGIPFNSTNFTNLSSGQQAILNTNELGTVDGYGSDRIKWLLGDQSKEAYLVGTTTANTAGYGWRSRSSTNLLGDVINSNPVFVGAPAPLPGSGYATFYATYKTRTPMVYVGGNDGMLHGYDASYSIPAGGGTPAAYPVSGTEKLAYVPSSVYKNLNKLMGSNYSHKYFVDGSPVVGEACFGTTVPCTAATSWKTMLVGGLNAGGQGIYALDVTNPSTFGASNVLWEFTDKDDADLGYTFSKPMIVKLNNGRWAVIFGNGYNNTVNDGAVSSTGRAYLYILYVDGPGNGNPWVLNTNYFKIELKSPTENSATILSVPNGLTSASGVDKDGNGTVDIIYVGDRDGNLWKIDMTSSTPSNWGAAFGSTLAPQPLFTAVTSTGAKEQITTGIEVSRHPYGGFLVMFGTGSWIDTTDSVGPFTTKTDSFYGIWDKDDGATRVTSRSLLQQERVMANVTSSGASCTPGSVGCWIIMSNCQPNYSPTNDTATATPLCSNSGTIAPQLGYYFDLPGAGERIRSSAPLLSSGVVTFTTLSPASDPCTGNTLGFEYSLDFLSGGAPTNPFYQIPGASSGLIPVTLGGQTVYVPAAGTSIPGGATDNPLRFTGGSNLGESGACTVPTPPPGMPSSMPGSACGGGGSACPDYIPGWGFLLNNRGGSAISESYYLSCTPPPIGTSVPNCTCTNNNGRYGRLGWKPINR